MLRTHAEVVLVSCAIWCGQVACKGKAVHYEPSLVVLAGRVVMERVYGPPNFGETPNVDARYEIPVLHLDSSVCVVPDRRSGPDSDLYTDVRRIHVYFPTPPGFDIKGILNRHVTLEGTLREGAAPEDRTDVVMDVRRVLVGRSHPTQT